MSSLLSSGLCRGEITLERSRHSQCGGPYPALMAQEYAKAAILFCYSIIISAILQSASIISAPQRLKLSDVTPFRNNTTCNSRYAIGTAIST